MLIGSLPSHHELKSYNHNPPHGGFSLISSLFILLSCKVYSDGVDKKTGLGQTGPDLDLVSFVVG
uniref:Uncharacterized protein n=1 Tax=Anguilla anguilla TaxID=7936 RepID=A0A0E9WIN0_ANGAN